METARTVTAIPAPPTRQRLFFSALRYLAGKALTILATIFVGVFLTMLIVNFPVELPGESPKSPFEATLEWQIRDVLQSQYFNPSIRRDANGQPLQSELDALEEKLREEAGLNLPFLPRYLLWTAKALRFDWGQLYAQYYPDVGISISQGLVSRLASTAVLQYLPNTLLLVGTAYLLVFLIGMPFSLYLARNYGGWLDRVMSVLSPISSVPSWVFAVLLVTIFAVQLRWLPVAGMFDFYKPKEPIPYALALLKHMILPVSALVLSLLFQLVYTWRTFFVIYSEEDYVDLARAKGLNTRLLEKRYILRPALPYIITSFATSLIGFWQLTVALEKIFSWPGIGLLYIDVLPNFRGEGMQVGDLMVVIQIVVTFAYLLGILVFMLDLAYVILDPRIHLVPASQSAQQNIKVKSRRAGWKKLFAWTKPRPAARPVRKKAFSRPRLVSNLRESLRETHGRMRLFAEQLRLYPSAIFGLAIIALLLAGSIYALVALPYEEIGMDYNLERVTGRNLRPRTAAPAWLNVFSSPPRLSTLIMDENSSGTEVTTETLDNGWVQKTVTFTFDYPYRDLPSDVFLYLDSQYTEKIPFNSLEWVTPDGRTIDLKAQAQGGESSYDLQEAPFVRRLLLENPEWKNWFVEDGQYPTPAYRLLFAKPGSSQATPLRGTYQLKLMSLLFEPDSNVQPQLAVLGQVYGLAGTDYWRRDLVVPLFWGMPFTLVVGFIGTLITALVAILLPAIGVWFGGWLDSLIQRLTEVNMVLPGLAMAVLIYTLHGVHIWVILGIVVVLNALGAPIKSFRSAFLQAKEAPYIEMARSYGASQARLITRYLVPRILPVLIPYLVMQIPTFIFLEATLGFFRIRSIYPSWGKIIYEGLAQGALYGSPFWVLEPIFLLLLTGLGFAMLGLALERILNPRVLTDIPALLSPEQKAARQKQHPRRARLDKRLAAGVMLALVAIAIFIPSVQGKTLASLFLSYLDPSRSVDTRIRNPELASTRTPRPVPTFTLTAVSTGTSEPLIGPLDDTSTPAATVLEATLTPTPGSAPTPPATYMLRPGEFPYCIARRFDVDPGELLVLNGMLQRETFYAGTVIKIPQTGHPYPGERMQKAHPATYTVAAADETLFSVACQFGDVDPQAIAQANGLALDSTLSVGQQLQIP